MVSACALVSCSSPSGSPPQLDRIVPVGPAEVEAQVGETVEKADTAPQATEAGCDVFGRRVLVDESKVQVSQLLRPDRRVGPGWDVELLQSDAVGR